MEKTNEYQQCLHLVFPLDPKCKQTKTESVCYFMSLLQRQVSRGDKIHGKKGGDGEKKEGEIKREKKREGERERNLTEMHNTKRIDNSFRFSFKTQRVNICTFTTYAGIVHTGFEFFNGLPTKCFQRKSLGICAK